MGIEAYSVIGWIFIIIGVVVVAKVYKMLYWLAKDSAGYHGAKVPLKYGLVIFVALFLLIKMFGYELDMGIAVIYFGLMLAGIAGIIRGRLLARNYREG